MVKILEVGSKLRVSVGQQPSLDTPNRSRSGGGKGSGTNDYYSKGFTVTEMMVTLAVVSILITVAVSNFRETARDTRLTTQINTLVSSLQLVRSEAIKRRTFVTMRRTGTNWEDGWQIFTDDPIIGVMDGTDQTLRVGAALSNNFMLRENNFPNRISFRSNGRSSQAGSFVLCDDSDGNGLVESRTSRMIIISPTGRVRIANDSDNNGIPEDSNDINITSCTAPF